MDTTVIIVQAWCIVLYAINYFLNQEATQKESLLMPFMFFF